jgi:serine protease
VVSATTSHASAIDAEHAWDLTTGSSGVVVAVLDTSVRFDHPDLAHAAVGGRLLPGYDFISDAVSANDGDGRDVNATDPGDFVSQADVGTAQFRDCDVVDSSWHGTRVAGLIGARTNNLEGIAGGTWSPWILPVRALGNAAASTRHSPAMLWAWRSGRHTTMRIRIRSRTGIR